MAATTRSSSTANLFAFEEILDFNGHKGDSAASQQKQLACLRCHAQKLGCVRHEHNGACERCRATKVNCVARQPQRMGRPADSRWPGRRGHQRQEESSEHQQPSPSPLSTVNTAATTSTTSSTTTSESNNTSISAVSPPNTSVTMSSIWPSPLQDMPREDTSSMQNWSFAEYPLDGTPAYEGSLFPGPGGLDSMLPNFEDCPSEVLDHITKWAQNAPSAASLEAQDNPAGSIDPTEQLTKLHLDLHECLIGMQLMEARARTKQPGGSNVFPGTKTIDQAFHISERFVQILNELPMEEKENSRPIPAGQLGKSPFGARCSLFDRRNGSSNNTNSREARRSRSYAVSDGFLELGDFPSVNSATELMIMSCYIRLLHVFEVIVSLLASGQSMTSMMEIEIHFGIFSPRPDRTLKTRLLALFTSYLLDAMSTAVKMAVTSEPSFMRMIADIRHGEGKLREHLAAVLEKYFY